MATAGIGYEANITSAPRLRLRRHAARQHARNRTAGMMPSSPSSPSSPFFDPFPAAPGTGGVQVVGHEMATPLQKHDVSDTPAQMAALYAA